jgi:hypothetical protein
LERIISSQRKLNKARLDQKSLLLLRIRNYDLKNLA